MKKILPALLMGFVGLNADERLLEIMRLYQKQGLEVVGQKLDSYLADKSFWAEELQNKDTDFGYYQNKQFLFVADKSKPSLEFYEIENNML
ncbi:peptidase, partial [Helicobacter pylori]